MAEDWVAVRARLGRCITELEHDWPFSKWPGDIRWLLAAYDAQAARLAAVETDLAVAQQNVRAWEDGASQYQTVILEHWRPRLEQAQAALRWAVAQLDGYDASSGVGIMPAWMDWLEQQVRPALAGAAGEGRADA